MVEIVVRVVVDGDGERSRFATRVVYAAMPTLHGVLAVVHSAMRGMRFVPTDADVAAWASLGDAVLRDGKSAATVTARARRVQGRV